MSKSKVSTNTEDNLRSPKVAIIGLRASGKTILMAALAHKLNVRAPNTYYLKPCNNQTLTYMDDIWSQLKAGDWPASTTPGSMVDLKWTLEHDKFKKSYEIRMIDPAGQDLSNLFSNDEIVLENLPEHLRTLAQYCRDADLLIVVLNIGDFTSEDHSLVHSQNQAALRKAVSYSLENRKRVCFVFSQKARYAKTIERNGGLIPAFQKYIPYVYNEYVYGEAFSVIAVSAVNKTQLKNLPGSAPIHVPAPDFESEGLEELVQWLTVTIQNIESEKRDRQISKSMWEFYTGIKLFRFIGKVWANHKERARIAKEKKEKRALEKKQKKLAHAQKIRALEEERANVERERSRIRQEKMDEEREQLQRQEEIRRQDITQKLQDIQIRINDIDKMIAKNKEEKSFIDSEIQYSIPSPAVIDKKGFENCTPGILWGCSSHGYKVNVQVSNSRGPGKVVVRASIYTGGKLYRQDEKTIYLDTNSQEFIWFTFHNLGFCPQNSNPNNKWGYEITTYPPDETIKTCRALFASKIKSNAEAYNNLVSVHDKLVKEYTLLSSRL